MITVGDLQGHWCRDWIKAPGLEDHDTRVHWLQAGALFVDIRVPSERPELSERACLADLSPEELVKVMQAEGFAGRISVSEDRCTWHRDVNWHGEQSGADIGAMSFRADGMLIEDGVLAEHRELWRPMPGAGLRGRRITCAGQTGVLIESETVFLLGFGSAASSSSAALIKALETGKAERAALAAHFASTYCLGHWNGSDGVADLSTNPFDEGRVVLTRGADLIWRGASFNGSRAATPIQIVDPSEAGDEICLFSPA
ncbi:MAG: hypothetical protein AAGA05_13190 [Pseudomonadota bacterium]